MRNFYISILRGFSLLIVILFFTALFGSLNWSYFIIVFLIGALIILPRMQNPNEDLSVIDFFVIPLWWVQFWVGVVKSKSKEVICYNCIEALFWIPIFVAIMCRIDWFPDIYLKVSSAIVYVFGVGFTWELNRSRREPLLAKIFVSLVWPVVVIINWFVKEEVFVLQEVSGVIKILNPIEAKKIQIPQGANLFTGKETDKVVTYNSHEINGRMIKIGDVISVDGRKYFIS